LSRIFLLWKKFSTKSGNLSFIEEIYSKNMKYFFYRRNFIEKVEILLLWKK